MRRRRGIPGESSRRAGPPRLRLEGPVRRGRSGLSGGVVRDPPMAGGTSAAAADKSKVSGGKGKLTPSAAGETSAAAVSKPEQVSRPSKPALPAAGETSAAAAGAAERLGRVTGCRPNYRIPRLFSPIREGYLENFQALPEVLDGCIIRAPETVQDKFFFRVLMEAGMVLSGREARDYSGAHFRLQRKIERRSYSD